MRTIEEIISDLLANTREMLKPHTPDQRRALADSRQTLLAEKEAALAAQAVQP